MKKITLLFLSFIFIISVLTLSLNAESDTEIPETSAEDNGTVTEEPTDTETPDDTADVPSDDTSAADEATDDTGTSESHTPEFSNCCLCGRDYYKDDTATHSKYDCVKCGKNMYACTCPCWCGAASYLDTSGEYGSVLPRICSGCGKPCPLCTCRSDKAAVLEAELKRLNGEVSPLNLPRPESGWETVISVFLILILCSAATWLSSSAFAGRSRERFGETKELPIASFFSSDKLKSIGKVVSRTKEKAPVSEKTEKDSEPEAQIQTGFIIYEKVYLPWIESGRGVSDVAEAASAVIENETNEHETAEKLRQNKVSGSDRPRRFPDIFGG